MVSTIGKFNLRQNYSCMGTLDKKEYLMNQKQWKEFLTGMQMLLKDWMNQRLLLSKSPYR
jgi:hypothetical protein